MHVKILKSKEIKTLLNIHESIVIVTKQKLIIFWTQEHPKDSQKTGPRESSEEQ